MTVSMQTMRNIASVRGDLSGSLMDPKVVGIQGIAISETLPQDGEALVYSSATGKYEPGTVASGGVGSGTGSQGPKGDTGETGPQGPSGSQGPKGDTGATGAIGPSGSQGPKGDTGETGPQGPSGTPANLSEYLTIASASANLSSSNLTVLDAIISNNLSVVGNLIVNGTMTSVNSTNLEITDKYILIASGASDAAALHGAGLQFGTVPSEDARIVYDAINDEMEIYPAARSAEFRGAFVGDGSAITGTPYDIGGEVIGSIVSGSELMNYLSPRAFTIQAFSQYTGSGAATAIVKKNGLAITYPNSVSVNDLVSVISNTTGSKAYFTIKGIL